LFAATGGDDYALLLALASEFDPLRLSLPRGTTIVRIGSLSAEGHLLTLSSGGKPVPLPERLGFEHQGYQSSGDPSSPMADRS
jgi:thiamine-monophosphate kinase